MQEESDADVEADADLDVEADADRDAEADLDEDTDASTDSGRDGDRDHGTEGPLPTSLISETWHRGSETCDSASLVAGSSTPGQIDVSLLQVPQDDVVGSCTGHVATSSLLDVEISIEIDRPGGGACWTACWDFEISISDVPPGSYTVRYGSLSDTVTVL